jgi:hypothetical protein
MKKIKKEYPKPIKVEIVKGKPVVITDRLVIIKPVYYN